jgi:hypothetical protein
MAAATSEPYVVATLEPSRWSIIHMDLVLENSGSGPAFDVQLHFEPPLIRERTDQNHVAPLNNIAVLRAGQTLRDYVGNSAATIKNDYRVTVSWRASPTSSARNSNSYELKLGFYRGMMKLGGNDPEVQIAQETKKLRETIEKAFTGARRLEVDTYTQRDRLAESEALERSFEEMEATWGKSLAISPADAGTSSGKDDAANE